MPEHRPSMSGDTPLAAGLDPLFHEPARLALLSALAPVEYVDFSALLKIVNVSKSSLSKHLSTLSEAGVVSISQNATDKRGRRVSLTQAGRSGFNAYLVTLRDLVQSAQQQSDQERQPG